MQPSSGSVSHVCSSDGPPGHPGEIHSQEHLPTKPPTREMSLRSSHGFEDTQRVYPFSFHAGAVPADNEHDLSMIMFYLDHIFPLQYYFYRPTMPGRGRGWLLSLLLRANSSYFSTLAFSSLSKLMFAYNGDSIMAQNLSVDLDRYHSRAISELQVQLDFLSTTSGHDHLKLGVEILACMLQLMSIEVFRETKQYTGWKDDWEVHLQGAETILFVIGTELRTSSASSPASNSRNESPGQQPSDVNDPIAPLLLNEMAGLDFFLKAYIWSDVFRCASIGLNTPNALHFSYLPYLEEDRIRLDEIMGCRNWVMIAIKEISNLNLWKKEMQTSRTLSIHDLSHKGARLEDRLRGGLENLMKDQNISKTYQQECNLVTELYAISALIYLSTVISGNSHLLPEVRSSVVKALDKLKTLPPHLLIRISWAYCVAGCMADEGEKEEFRQLLFGSHEKGHLLGTLWNGLEIMEEFWILRDDLQFMQTADKCPWALAMDSLGAKILLI